MGFFTRFFALMIIIFVIFPCFFSISPAFFGGFCSPMGLSLQLETELEAVAASSARPRTATSPRCGTSSGQIRGAACTRNNRPMAGGLSLGWVVLWVGWRCQKMIQKFWSLVLREILTSQLLVYIFVTWTCRQPQEICRSEQRKVTDGAKGEQKWTKGNQIYRCQWCL